jgi:hypothetical protein
VNDVEKLVATQEIRALMARRVRCLDTKDWDGFADCYTSDAVSHSFQQGDTGEPPTVGTQVIDDLAPTVGARAIADRVAEALSSVTTVHQVHEPEIVVLSEDSATGLWPLMDLLVWDQDGGRRYLHGYGHYRQVYEKVDGRWLIKEHWLTRLRVETGLEDQA